MRISIALIYIALVLQFRNTVKPLLVFAAIPYGIVGALAALWIMGDALRLHGVPRASPAWSA